MKTSPSLFNYSRAQKLMSEQGLEALIAASAPNVTYACAFYSPSPHVFHSMQVFGLMPRNSQAGTLIVPRDELTYIGVSPASVEDIRTYGETTLQWTETATYEGIDAEVFRLMTSRPRHPDPVQALVSAIVDRGLQRARLGIDERGILPVNFEQLRRQLPEVEFVEASDLWLNIRAIKTAPELELLRRGAEINEAALGASIEAARIGTTQTELYETYHEVAVRHGALLHYWGGGVGPESALFAPPKPNHPGRAGDVIRIDGAMTFELYWADTGRTIVLGNYTDKQKQYYEALYEGMQAGLAQVRPGASAAQIFDTIVQTVKAAGIPHYFRFHCGHGLGVDFYEIPSIRPATNDSDDTYLKEGMVLNLEVPYYELNFGGMQIEDTVLVTSEGYELLTKRDRSLIVK